MTVDHLRYDKNHEEYLRVGRNLLDDLTRSMALSGIGVGHRTIDPPDGTRIIVSSRNGGNDIEIIPPEKRLPLEVEEEKKEIYKEEIPIFFAIGATITSDSETTLYLGVFEPEQSGGSREDGDYIADNRRKFLSDEHVGIDTSITIPETLINGEATEESAFSGVYCRSNSNGMTSFVPADDGFLGGHDTAVILDTRSTVLDGTDEIEINPVAGEYAAKLAITPSCSADETDIAITVLLGYEEEDGDLHVIEKEYSTTISWDDKEIADSNARWVVPFGEEPSENEDPEDYYLPPSCFSWETETLGTGPALGLYGPNPHAKNVYQGSILINFNGSSAKHHEDEYIPWVGYEEGEMIGEFDLLADMGLCDECDQEPQIGEYNYVSEARIQADYFRTFAGIQDKMDAPCTEEAFKIDTGFTTGFDNEYWHWAGHWIECNEEGSPECYNGGAVYAYDFSQVSPSVLPEDHPYYEMVYAAFKKAVWQPDYSYMKYMTYPLFKWKAGESIAPDTCVQAYACPDSGGLCGDPLPPASAAWWFHGKWSEWFWWAGLENNTQKLPGISVVLSIEGFSLLENDDVMFFAEPNNPLPDDLSSGVRELDWLSGLSYAELPEQIKSLIRPHVRPPDDQGEE